MRDFVGCSIQYTRACTGYSIDRARSLSVSSDLLQCCEAARRDSNLVLSITSGPPPRTHRPTTPLHTTVGIPLYCLSKTATSSSPVGYGASVLCPDAMKDLSWPRVPEPVQTRTGEESSPCLGWTSSDPLSAISCDQILADAG
jgi:hypothetical protein